MKKIAFSTPTSLGEIINIKGHFDAVKHQYSEIRLNFDISLWETGLHTDAPDWEHKKSLWHKYLNDIGELFFMEPPYVLDRTGKFKMYDMGSMWRVFGLTPTKVELGHLLCAGEPLNLGEEYVVITTKVRHVNKATFLPKSIQLWKILKEISKKYKIVILGERVVEMRREYDCITHEVFGLYDQIIANLPNDRILDLSVPALGETVADLKDIRQDCLIMRDAKFVLSIGCGGNTCMSTSTAGMSIGFRGDNLEFANILYNNRTYPNCIMTKDWNLFIRTLENYT